MRRTASAYLIATLGVGAIAALRVALRPWLGEASLFLVFIPPVLAAAALGGAAPALLATCLSVIGAYATGWAAGAAPDPASTTIFAAIGAALAAAGAEMAHARRRAAARSDELREREAHLQRILDTVPDALIVTDERGLVQSFSPAAERTFGWTPAEVIGRDVGMLSPEASGGAWREAGGGARVVTGLRRDGASFPIELSVGEIRVAGRRFFSGFARDLSERQAAEARLQALQAELAHVARLMAMGEMASALAHELNQPLSAIANYLKGARRLLDRGEAADRPRLCEALAKAGDQAIRAGEVIRGLRGFVRPGEAERCAQSLGRLIEEASALALVGAGPPGLRLSIDIDPGAEPVLADRVQIQQVVVNLMRNAVEAMRGLEHRELRVRAAAHGDGLAVISVSDTGAGISERARGRLFEPFATTKPDGMGVGLSICRTIVEAHGGSIWASNNPGAGATFAFTLPLAEALADA